MDIDSFVTPVYKMNRDMMKALRQSGGGITDNEARFLVDLYYTMQKSRIAVNNQVKGLDRDAKKADNEAEPHDGLDWTLRQFETLEGEVAKILRYYTEAHPMAWFFEQTLGVGPVLSAGLLAHIDITKAPTVGHIWNFAGLNPDVTWEKGQKRPWNTGLKTLCWKIGDSFVKLSSRPDSLYSRIYKERKADEWARNLSGQYSKQAAEQLQRKKYGKSTDAYSWYSGQCSADKAAELLAEQKAPTAAACRVEEGGTPMLSPAHIDARARRYAVKLFLSHLHECWWEQETGEAPPKPFAIAILNHAHYIAPPQKRPVALAA